MEQIVFRIQGEKIYFVDRLFFELLGLSEQEIQGQHYQQVLSQYISIEVAQYFADLLSEGKHTEYRRVFVNDKDGGVLPLSIFGYSIQTSQGPEIMGTIIETKQLNQELFGTLDDLSYMQQALNSSVILAITDTEGRITYANQHFCAISGYESHELIGRTHRMVNSGFHPRSFFKEMWETITQGKTWRGEVKNKKKDGSCYWADSTIVPMLNENGQPFQYMAIRYNITNQKQNEERIRLLANSDSLTELPNRRMFDEELLACIKEATSKKEKFGVLFIDLDSFKYVNDTKGHSIGDQLLIKVSQRLREIVGGAGMVARLGGDEFAVIVYSIESITELKRTAETLIEKFKAPFYVSDLTLRMTCSVGVAIFPESGTDTETIMKSADLAMYQVKNTHKNGYMFSISLMSSTSQRLFQIQNSLRESHYDEQFHLVYQPKVSATDGKVKGMEALLRWDHPELGKISPSEFIPIAEEIGMINEMNDWVLVSLCKQINQWASKGYQLLPVAINLSVSQFVHSNFEINFLNTLTKYGVDPTLIEVEITENMFIDNEVRAQEILKTMKDHGIKVALDDFGTGYSSLSYLMKLDLDILKIDKSLIQGISKNFKEEKVVATVIQLGKALGLKVVAEGIETKQELDILVASGVDEIQGFYYSRPLEIAQTEQLLLTKQLP